MYLLWLLIPCVYSFIRTNEKIYSSKNTELKISKYNLHKKISTGIHESVKSWFIKRAEKNGINWKGLVSKYEDKNTMLALKMWKKKKENTFIEYPKYYLKNFHGYENGNLEWKSATELEAATKSVSCTYWEGVDGYTSENWMRYNVTEKINYYLNKHNIYIDKIVDFGCSIGISTEYLFLSYPTKQIIGIDLSPYFIAVASHRNNKLQYDINYLHENIENTTLDSNVCDMVTCMFVLHEVPKDISIKIIQEAHRILKPNGVLVLVDLDQEKLKKTLSITNFRLWAFETTEPHIQQYYNNNLIELLYSNGFGSIESYSNDPMNTIFISRKMDFKQVLQYITPKINDFNLVCC